MSKKNVMRPQLWTKRSVSETIAVYEEWADDYDSDVTKRGYRTPARIAAALLDQVSTQANILDFGCGTGLSGVALQAAGFDNFDGTDITAAMLKHAEQRRIYRHIWQSQPGEMSFGRGTYDVIVAAGVVSLGAAPPDLLADLVSKLDVGQLLALSYNDPTLQDQSYIDALSLEVAEGHVEVIFRAHGPHLDDADMGSDVILLKRR